MTVRLVKDDKVLRLPRVRGDVERTIQRAVQKAKKERWKKVFFVGEGPHGYTASNSKMTYYELLGLIEYSKKVILDELD